MGSLLVVMAPPLLQLILGVLEGLEPVLVEALLTETTVERLDKRVVRGLPGPAEVDCHPV